MDNEEQVDMLVKLSEEASAACERLADELATIPNPDALAMVTMGCGVTRGEAIAAWTRRAELRARMAVLHRAVLAALAGAAGEGADCPPGMGNVLYHHMMAKSHHEEAFHSLLGNIEAMF